LLEHAKPGREVRAPQPARHATEVDAEILDAGAVRDDEIRRDADQQLVQREALGTKRHELAELEPREAAQLLGGAQAREHVLGTQDRRQVQELARDLRLQARIPRTFGGRARDRDAHPATIACARSKCDGLRAWKRASCDAIATRPGAHSIHNM